MRAANKNTVTVPRLNRAKGQVQAIIRMIEEERTCDDIITQLRAARAALRAVEHDILEHHVRECVSKAWDNKNSAQRDKMLNKLFQLLRRYEHPSS